MVFVDLILLSAVLLCAVDGFASLGVDRGGTPTTRMHIFAGSATNPFVSLRGPTEQPRPRRSASPLCMVVEIGPPDDESDMDSGEDTPLGQMKLSEIKSELDLRVVSYNDCFDRDSLEARLNEARVTGKADPKLIDEFNRRNLEANVQGEKFDVSDEVLNNSVGGDGTLPGGMPPEMLKELMNDPELVTMLRSTKMQDVMKLVMSEGQEALEEAMENDWEMYECVQKLNRIMGKSNQE